MEQRRLSHASGPGRAGHCYDNVAMEFFWGKLKTESVRRRAFAHSAEARTAIFEHVEGFYNRRRLHIQVTCGF